jgi:hypothetical protein
MPDVPAMSWRPMNTAPRDGTHILIAFGQDWTSSAVYVRADGDNFPWKFIDSQGEGRPVLNGARDDEYGPSGWMPLPKWASPHLNSLKAAWRTRRTAPASQECAELDITTENIMRYSIPDFSKDHSE